MKNGAVMYDKSYYSIFEIVSKSAVQLNQLLVRLNAISPGHSIGEKIITFQMDKNTDNLFALKSSSVSCVIIANPWLKDYLNDTILSTAASEDLKIGLSDLTDLFNVFELNGPICLQRIGLVLSAINLGENHSLLKLVSQFETTPAHYLPPNLVCSFECQYNPTKRDLQPPIVLQNGAKGHLTAQNNRFTELVHFIQAHKMNATEEHIGGFFKFGKSLDHHNFLGRFLEGTRGRYTHKTNKKNYDTPRDDMPGRPIEPMDEEQLEPITEQKREAIKAHEEEWHKGDMSLSKRIRAEEQKPFPVLLANLSSRKEAHDRILLLVPSGFGKKIWRQLFIKGTKAAGRLEYEHAFHQLDKRVFPQDFPHSRFFAEYEQEQHTQAFDAFLRRPPAKRVNYVKIGSPFPFSFNFKEILDAANLVPTGTALMTHENVMSHYVNRNLRMLRNRVPKAWAYIYFPTEEDFVSLVKQYATDNMTEDGLMNGKHGEVICLQPNIPKPGKTKDRHEYEQQLSQIELSGPRELIGRVTSGFLKYSSGKGEGYSTVLLAKVQELEAITEHFSLLHGCRYLNLKKGEALVLMRNTQGVHYHFAVLSTN
jgi:hypothetical protein